MTANDTRVSNHGSNIVWTGAVALLLLPAVATQFTPEINWSASDFLAWAVMLASAGGGYEFLARKASN